MLRVPRGERDIVGGGDLEIAGGAGQELHRLPQTFDQAGIVASSESLEASGIVCPGEGGTGKRLGGLHPPQSVTRHGAKHPTIVVGAFDRVTNGDGRDCAASCPP